MDSFYLFDERDGVLYFHAEHCTATAVHTHEGLVRDVKKLCAALGTAEAVAELTKRFSSDGFFAFLSENGIPFETVEKKYSDLSADV